MLKPKRVIPDAYIGDGVYASFDGYMLWLDTRGQEPCHRIALEPEVIVGLEAYLKALRERLAREGE